jgi:exosortase
VTDKQRRQTASSTLARRVAPLFGLGGVATLGQDRSGSSRFARSLPKPKSDSNAGHASIPTGSLAAAGLRLPCGEYRTRSGDSPRRRSPLAHDSDMSDAASITPPVPAKPPLPPLSEEVAGWFKERWSLIADWVRREPRAALWLGAFGLTIIAFFGVLPLFSNYSLTAFRWVWQAWNPETNYEHGILIPWIALFLFLHALPKLRGLPVGSSRWGIWWLAGGIFLFLVAARTLQPRLAVAAVPFLALGLVLYVWGPAVSRVLLFPILFLLFAVPLNFIEQATFRLQFISTALSSAVCNFIGIKIAPLGTTMRAVDDSFQFEIAGGCSGINSLMAITMLTAIFVHFTQDKLWKKLVLFGLSAIFAIIGNVARITVIMAVAKYVDPTFAGGKFHEYSAYLISFPFAFVAMYYASKLVNLNPSALRASVETGLKQADPAGKANPASYDY